MINLSIPSLGDKFQDYRMDIRGDSFNWGPVVNASKIKYFALHHSVTPQTAKTDGNWKKECDKIADLHIDGRGWAGIGYCFIICSDGTVAYVGDLSHGGSAVGGNNDTIFSACMVGDFTKELPTATQIHSAHILVDWFINHMPQYPLITSWDNLIGHQDAASILKLPGAEPTACPGTNWRSAGDSLRDRVIADRFTGYPDPQPAGQALPQPEPTPTPDVDCEKRIAGFQARNTDLTKQLATEKTERLNREEQVSRLKDQLLKSEESAETIRKAHEKMAKEMETTIGLLQGQVDATAKEKGSILLEKAQLEAKITILERGVIDNFSISDLLSIIIKKLTPGR